MSLLSGIRLLWLGGFYGTGKTVMATFLAAQLYHAGLVERVISNVRIRGESDPRECVPDGCVYYSKYLDRVFLAGERFPFEDTAFVLDEAGMFIKNASEADDYSTALRKTNLFLLMPSIKRPAVSVTMFELRKTFNYYSYGLPMWKCTWLLTNGKVLAEKGHFWIWRPDRIFGISQTREFPSNDNHIASGLSYTFQIDKLQEFRDERSRAKRSKVLELDSSALDGIAGELEEVLSGSVAWNAASGTRKRT